MNFMVPLILATAVGGYIISEVYKKFATPEQKRKLQNFVNMHHGEAGALMTLGGIAAKSPSLVGTGIGLMVHDKNDSNKWFQRNRTRRL